MLAEHGSAATALASLPEVAKAAGVKDYTCCPETVATEELKAGRIAGARPIAYGSEHYPAALLDLPDAPPILWAMGDVALLQKPMIALVGARNASSLGTRMARALAEGLGREGHVIVSGLARGIDTSAHMSALESGTIAVLAGGVDVVYPAENAVLAQEIAEKGLRLSEQPMGMAPMARHFPTRNRIVSGLSRGVVVVEAAAKSGSLITARNALDQGREVLVVPGHPFDARAAGCNMLIRDGATLVRNAQDVIEALHSPTGLPVAQPSPEPAPPPEPPREAVSLKEANALHNEILSRLGPTPIAEDQLIRDINAPAQTVAPQLVTLELEGKIRRQAGGMLALA
ncbi:Rossmann fold nucleotide-binding protein Smf [Candidatus Rhodobacter oscarellae]|uniref:Rossmann fold nucleotide-binding protein Smf n=1 Tax=Candidatus Rhodobacter oscarellae TaxID=1675527 RepID=A0A0J9EA74_9RHOB|nr:Rossmann fold nucleotide-binding protein Smf [Candidatus Rhodobacter lobularis]